MTRQNHWYVIHCEKEGRTVTCYCGNCPHPALCALLYISSYTFLHLRRMVSFLPPPLAFFYLPPNTLVQLIMSR